MNTKLGLKTAAQEKTKKFRGARMKKELKALKCKGYFKRRSVSKDTPGRPNRAKKEMRKYTAMDSSTQSLIS